jgi:hypothetical protein
VSPDASEESLDRQIDRIAHRIGKLTHNIEDPQTNEKTRKVLEESIAKAAKDLAKLQKKRNREKPPNRPLH